jgi:hypothetical protein
MSYMQVNVNWCPALGTVLANEEIIDGKSERGGHPVVRQPLRYVIWFIFTLVLILPYIYTHNSMSLSLYYFKMKTMGFENNRVCRPARRRFRRSTVARGYVWSIYCILYSDVM